MLFCLAPSAHAGGPLPLSGSILGEVKSVAGVAEMGAKVLLYDRHEQIVRQALTNEQGRFGVRGAGSGRVLDSRDAGQFCAGDAAQYLASRPGTENLLQINLSGIFSTVDILSSAAHGTLMGDDWKWVLRASPSTRPILRFLPDAAEQFAGQQQRGSVLRSMFSQTEGILKCRRATAMR